MYNPTSPFLHELAIWLQELNQPSAWYQVAVLLVAVVGAWAMHHYLGNYLEGSPAANEATRLRHFTLRSAQRVLFPISMLIAVLIGRGILHRLEIKTAVLNIAVPLLLSLAAIRVLVYMLRKGFSATPALKAWEHVVSTGIWGVVALHLLGHLPAVTAALDELAFNVGSFRISLLSSLNLVFMVVLLMTLAYWLAGVIEQRLKASIHVSPAMQVTFAKFSRFFLITVAFLLSLQAVGIDLTALAVFGGAVGVGLGFGLQRIASNFISGFILVLDRSIQPGDVITIRNSFGWVQELRARYVVVRDREGLETLIPNETLITSEVINWSYTDPKVRLRMPLQISYNDDPEQAMSLMVEAAKASSRVLPDPAPAARLMEFADNGIALELRVWISDPIEGLAIVRSDIYLAIWRAFKQAGITIPYPQRDLYLKEAPEGLRGSADV